MISKKINPLVLFSALLACFSCSQDDANITFSDQEFFSFDEIVYSIESSTFNTNDLNFYSDTLVDSTMKIDVIKDTTLIEEEDTTGCVTDGGEITNEFLGTGTTRLAGFIPTLYECVKSTNDTSYIHDTTFIPMKLSAYKITLISDEYNIEIGIPLESLLSESPTIEEDNVLTFDLGSTAYYSYNSASSLETDSISLPYAFLTLENLTPDYATIGTINVVSLDEDGNVNITFSLLYNGESLVGKYEGPVDEIN